jgi:signal transduction histidine kinase
LAGLPAAGLGGDTDAVSVKLKAYVALVCTVGAALVVGLAATVDPERLRQNLPAVGLFGAFVVVGELVVVPIRRRGQVRELTVTNTFAYALALLAGTAIGVLVLVAASVVADLTRRKAPIKVAFNAAQWAIALAVGGGICTALGGGQRITAASVPALIIGGAVFLLVNHALVGAVVSLATDTPLRRGLLADLRIEVGTSAMLLALAPIAVLTAQQALPLVPALLLPILAVHLASKGELEARQRRADAEALAAQHRRLAADAEAAAERQRRLAEQEQQLVRQLQDADRMKQDLIATVTHELRSPLTTISGTYQTLRVRAETLTADRRDELLDMGLRQTDRLTRMVEQLLLAARFQQGVTPLPLPQTELDAAVLVRQTAAEAQARHPNRAFVIQTDGPLPVRAAQDAVVQILGNLIDNACKYSPDGGPVRVVAARQGATAVLAVEDGGPGIPLGDRQRIFQRFTQLDSGATRRAGGVGLGLYIARQLARGQAGELLVTDAGGPHGARFELQLPLLAEAVGS